jgi:hypothetical protein
MYLSLRRVVRRQLSLRLALSLLTCFVGLLPTLFAQTATGPAPVKFATTAVGATSAASSLTFTFNTGGTIKAPAVLTQGATGLDFADAGTGTCTTNGTSHTYAAGDKCTVNVTFKPRYAGTRFGAVMLKNSGGAAIATTLVYGTGSGPEVVFSPSTLSSLGGGFASPAGVAVDASGNVYVADPSAVPTSPVMVVKEVPPGCVSSACVKVLGGGFLNPTGVAVDGAGNVYVADTFNSAVKKMPAGCSTFSCTTMLGGGFSYPAGVAVDGSGNVYVADADNNAVKKVPAGCSSSACVATLGGGFYNPGRVAPDDSGNVYVADTHNNAVKEIPSGCTLATCVKTLGGGFNLPTGVVLDAGGNVYVTDLAGVKQIPPSCTSSACVTFLGGVSQSAGLAMDGSGNFYATDPLNAAVKEIHRASPPSLSFLTTKPGTESSDSPKAVSVSNIGNTNLTFPPPASGGNPSVANGFTLDVLSTCPELLPSSAAQTLGAGKSCTYATDFKPTAGGTYSGSVVLTDNALNVTNATQTIPVSGKGLILPAMSSPVPGSTLGGSSATFTWSAGTGPQAYMLYVGTLGAGSSNVYKGGATTSTSAAVSNIPTNGVWLYVRLSYEVNGSWNSIDYKYTEAGTMTAPKLTTPAPGSTLGGSSVTFTWTAGAGPQYYKLYVGTLGVGTANVYQGSYTTATSAAVSNIPTNGVWLYVRLYYMVNGSWNTIDYKYTEAGTMTPPKLTTPAPGSTLVGSSATFTWTAGGGPQAYVLYVGTLGAGTSNVYKGVSTTGTSAAVSNIPTNGVWLYVRLYYMINGSWNSIDYKYTEAGTMTPPALTTPAPGSTLVGSGATFTWTAGGGPQAYALYVGTLGVGTSNLYKGTSTTSTSAAVSNIPTNGVWLYVRLYYEINGSWNTIDYKYTEAGTMTPPKLTTPAPGSTLAGSSATFTWTAGAGPQYYKLYVGTLGVGTANVYQGSYTTATSAAVSNIPTNGATLYVRLYYMVNGSWNTIDYTYKEQ